MNTRKANDDDLDSLVSLNAEVQQTHVELFPHIFRSTETNELKHSLIQSLKSDTKSILLAEDDNSVVGYMVISQKIQQENLLIHELRCGYIDQVCITQVYRKKGVFKLLLEVAKNEVRSWGFDRIELDVWSDNSAAKEAFIHSGFQSYNEKMLLQI
ncbi:GNAT family N-acetyltransferase [Rubritalea sp.]|uniref:GNAT family N-acetyltransferase n=1 Tax=Rubritalea sp. TaxID=2109375 RepID=UPI003EF4570E